MQQHCASSVSPPDRTRRSANRIDSIRSDTPQTLVLLARRERSISELARDPEFASIKVLRARYVRIGSLIAPDFCQESPAEPSVYNLAISQLTAAASEHPQSVLFQTHAERCSEGQNLTRSSYSLAKSCCTNATLLPKSGKYLHLHW
jgi:hypothetical protein